MKDLRSCQGLKVKNGKKLTLNGRKSKSVIKYVAENIRPKVKRECKNQQLSLQIDTATRLDHNVFVVSPQFVKLNSWNCGTKRTWVEYSETLSQIMSIVSDNMIKT